MGCKGGAGEGGGGGGRGEREHVGSWGWEPQRGGEKRDGGRTL